MGAGGAFAADGRHWEYKSWHCWDAMLFLFLLTVGLKIWAFSAHYAGSTVFVEL